MCERLLFFVRAGMRYWFHWGSTWTTYRMVICKWLVGSYNTFQPMLYPLVLLVQEFEAVDRRSGWGGQAIVARRVPMLLTDRLTRPDSTGADSGHWRGPISATAASHDRIDQTEVSGCPGNCSAGYMTLLIAIIPDPKPLYGMPRASRMADQPSPAGQKCWNGRLSVESPYGATSVSRHCMMHVSSGSVRVEEF
jgi:hypothetical protein